MQSLWKNQTIRKGVDIKVSLARLQCQPHVCSLSALLCLSIFLSIFLCLFVFYMSSGAGNYYQTLQYSLILFIYLLFSPYLTPTPTIILACLICVSLYFICSYKMLILFFLYVKITYVHYILLYTPFFILLTHKSMLQVNVVQNKIYFKCKYQILNEYLRVWIIKIKLFIQYRFIEDLLCVRNCSRYYGYKTEQQQKIYKYFLRSSQSTEEARGKKEIIKWHSM